MTEPTYWNGEPCIARRVEIVVADDGRFPNYWARNLVGRKRAAVEVTYGGRTFYIDDADGQGWRKVTDGRGSPRWGSRSLIAERVIAPSSDDQASPGEGQR